MSFIKSLVKEKNNTYSIALDHGTTVAMLSNATGSTFQSQFEHCIPKRTKAYGKRYNITFRSKTLLNKRDVDSIVKQSEHSIVLNDNSHLCLWQTTLFDKTSIDTMFEELKSCDMTPDKTFVYGTWHLNNGRTYVEMGWEPGQTYTYAGKTTTPGIEFPPEIKQNVSNIIAPLFGVEPKDIWAHVVCYPSKSSLGWHSDAEQGIDPHFILSTTFLEHHSKGKAWGKRKSPGVRDFQVRKKKSKKKVK